MRNKQKRLISWQNTINHPLVRQKLSMLWTTRWSVELTIGP